MDKHKFKEALRGRGFSTYLCFLHLLVKVLYITAYALQVCLSLQYRWVLLPKFMKQLSDRFLCQSIHISTMGAGSILLKEEAVLTTLHCKMFIYMYYSILSIFKFKEWKLLCFCDDYRETSVIFTIMSNIYRIIIIYPTSAHLLICDAPELIRKSH